MLNLQALKLFAQKNLYRNEMYIITVRIGENGGV